MTITSSIHPDEHTHITNNTYGAGGDANAGLFVLLTGPGSRLTRPLKLLGGMLRDPRAARRSLDPRGWSRRTVVFTTMQSVEESLRLVLRPRRLGRGTILDTNVAGARAARGFLPVANRVAELAAARMEGVAQSTILDVARAVPTTAHLLGGAVIGAGPQDGVVDAKLRAFGYVNLMVCDGSVVPANPGVNPSLTITALAEHAMAHVPAHAERP